MEAARPVYRMETGAPSTPFIPSEKDMNAVPVSFCWQKSVLSLT
jgi:hypothetical protein